MPELFDNRSEEAEAVLSKMPHWLIRWGITMFFGIACSFLVISLIVKYPDVLKHQVIIKKEGDNNAYGEFYIAQRHLLKVKQGEEVILTLASYPAKTHGTLKAKVSAIAKAPRATDFKFKVSLALPLDGKTSLNKKLAYENNLLAQGEMILSKKNLFQRLFGF